MATQLNSGSTLLLPHSAITWKDIPKRPLKRFTSQGRKKKYPNHKQFPSLFCSADSQTPYSNLEQANSEGRVTNSLVCPSHLGSQKERGTPISWKPQPRSVRPSAGMVTAYFQNTFNLPVLWHRAHWLLAVKPLAQVLSREMEYLGFFA